jgi:hypothetical protein
MDGNPPRRLTRREVLASGTAFGTALLVGPGFIAHPGEAWAAEVAVLKPETMATLVQMARDIYPHDRLADRYYAAAVKAHDSAEGAGTIEAGVAALDALAVGQGSPSYVETGWEADRVAMLREIETTPFFQAVRGGLVVGLYNNPEVWPHFGYQGESYSHGGYVERGFDDIDWL